MNLDRDAIAYVLELAFGDQEFYLHYGDPELDYGSEWESIKADKAQTFRRIAALADKVGIHGESERWTMLAAELTGKESVKTTNIPKGGKKQT